MPTNLLRRIDDPTRTINLSYFRDVLKVGGVDFRGFRSSSQVTWNLEGMICKG
jgi:hypothetical protein